MFNGLARAGVLALLMLTSTFAAAQTPSASADYDAGMALGRGGNFVAAFPLLERAADAGHKDAMFVLGTMYSQGQGVTQSRSTARTWFEKAAVLGHAQAAYNLGIHHDQGLDTPVNPTRALAWYVRGAELGDAQSAYNAGHLYLQTGSTPGMLSDAFKYFLQAAESGVPRAQNAVGYAYRNGYGVPTDWDRAREWYRKAIAAGSDNAPHNMREIVRMSMVAAYGWEKDGQAAKSLSIYRDGCSVDLVQACIDLGRISYFGATGVAIDYTASKAAYAAACEEGQAAACRGHAYAALRTPGDRAGLRKALAFFDEACERKEFHDCFNAAWIRNEPQLGLFNRDETKRILSNLCFNEGYQTACPPVMNIMNSENRSAQADDGGPMGQLALNLVGTLATGLGALGQAYSAPSSSSYGSGYGYSGGSSSSTSLSAMRDAADWRNAINSISSIGTGYAASCRVGNKYC